MSALLSLTEGDVLPERTVGPITLTDIVRFAGASGDFNPLHHDRDYAENAGFPDVIVIGQMLAGVLTGWLSDLYGVESLREVAVRFRRPVHPGATLRLNGTVTGIEEATASVPRTAHLALSLQAQDEVCLTAIASVACG